MLLVVVGVVTKSAMVSTKLSAKDGVKSFIQTLLSAWGCCGEGKGWKGDEVQKLTDPKISVCTKLTSTHIGHLAFLPPASATLQRPVTVTQVELHRCSATPASLFLAAAAVGDRLPTKTHRARPTCSDQDAASWHAAPVRPGWQK